MDAGAVRLLSRLKTLSDGSYRVVSYRALTEGENRSYDTKDEIDRDLTILKRAETIDVRYRDGEVFLFKTLPKAFLPEEEEKAEKEKGEIRVRVPFFLLFLVAFTGGFVGAAVAVLAAVALC